MAKVTKQRVLDACKNVNQGMSPNAAARKVGLPTSKQLIEAGIVYKNPINGGWQGMIRIHDDRYKKFCDLLKDYRKVSRDKSHATREEAAKLKHTHTKVGIFRKIWNSIFG